MMASKQLIEVVPIIVYSISLIEMEFQLEIVVWNGCIYGGYDTTVRAGTDGDAWLTLPVPIYIYIS